MDLVSDTHAAVLAQIWGTEGVSVLVTEDSRSSIDRPNRNALLPESWERVVLPPTPAEFLRELRHEVAKANLDKYFVLAPWVPWRLLPEELRAPGPTALEELAYLTAVEAARPGARIGGLFPSPTLVGERAREFRRTVLSRSAAELVLFARTSPISWNTLLVVVGPEIDVRTRFFDLGTGTTERTQLVADFNELLSRESGETQHGYVVATPIPAEASLSFELRAPSLQLRKSELEHLGRTAHIEDLFHVFKITNHTGEDHRASANELPVLEARDILNGAVDTSEPRKKRSVLGTDKLLQAGDVVMREFIGAQSIHVAELPAGFPAMVPGAGVIVLRPKASTTADDVRLISAYLQTPLAAHVARAFASGTAIPRLAPSAIRQMLVPLPDEDLIAALRALDDADVQFDRWRTELRAARSSLFESPIRENRSAVLRAGRRLREIASAGTALEDIGTRVRSVYPLPIAFRWRTVDTSVADTEGYRSVLEAAEVLLVYAAVIGIVTAGAVGVRVPRLNQLREKLVTGRGLDFGSWSSLLQEVRESRALGAKASEIPIPELLDLWSDDESTAALQRLRDRRNDLAHLRGPSSHETEKAFLDAKADLLLLLSSAEFLSDYPLRMIERTRWRARDETLEYQYRELRGDHGLVPLSTAFATHQLEEGALYVFPRVGRPLRLSPIILRRACLECGVFSTFVIDRYDARDKRPLFKALEHGHEMSIRDTVDDLRFVGLLSSDVSP